MFAIIQTGGKQYRVKKGDVLRLEKIDKKEGSEVDFNQVLLLEQAGKTLVGQPYLKGKKVKGKILKQGRGEKIEVVKYKSKIRYRRKIGHRQAFSEVKIVSLAE